MSGCKGQASKRKRKARKRKRRDRLRRDAEVTRKYGIEAHSACGRKRRYPSEEAALSFASRSMNVYGSPPLKVYRCPYCHGWHLTHKK